MLKHFNNQFSSDVLKLEQSFCALSKIFNKLPIGDSFKKPFLEQSLKEKSAWYACLVNNNIDVLLLPEYLENKQSRNILLKKETEQYIKSFESFDTLSSKNNQEVFESILFMEDAAPLPSFDLFSSHIVKTESCPQSLLDLFSNWELNNESTNELENIIYQFVEWHETHQFSFSNQRQLVLWLNFKLWRLFGSVVFKINFENYFYHHWNKESRDTILSIKDFITFLHKASEIAHDELRNLYRQHIQYEQLKPSQKMASNYLFNNAFETHLSNSYTQQVSLNKTLLKKGFITLEDVQNKTQSEKLLPLIEELLQTDAIGLFNEGNEITLCLYPNKNTKGKLSKYANVEHQKTNLAINDFIEQNIVVEETPKTIVLPIKPTTEVDTTAKRKVFFG